jgi:hypothetical protein
VRLLLHQFLLLPFQVQLLYGKQDPTLQHLVEAKGALAVCRKGAHPGQVILLDTFGLGALGVAFPARPPMGVLGSRHALMVPSLLSNSISQVRSCSCHSSNATNVAAAAREVEDLHPPSSHDQRNREKQAQAIAGVD